jgi:hypothetical protein
VAGRGGGEGEAEGEGVMLTDEAKAEIERVIRAKVRWPVVSVEFIKHTDGFGAVTIVVDPSGDQRYPGPHKGNLYARPKFWFDKARDDPAATGAKLAAEFNDVAEACLVAGRRVAS